MKALSEKEATLFLQVEVIGQERYLSFVKEELEGSGSILDTLEKEKLRTYINNNKIVKVKTDNKDVQMWIILIAICFCRKFILDVSTLNITFAAEANFVTQCFSQTLFSLDPF